MRSKKLEAQQAGIARAGGQTWTDDTLKLRVDAEDRAKAAAMTVKTKAAARELARKVGQVVLYRLHKGANWTLGQFKGVLTEAEALELHESHAKFVHFLVFTSFGPQYSKACYLEWAVDLWAKQELYFLPASAGEPGLVENQNRRPRAPQGDVMGEQDFWIECTQCREWGLCSYAEFKKHTLDKNMPWKCPGGCAPADD